MKVWVLIGINNIDVRDEQDNVIETYESRNVVGVYQSEQDAKHDGWAHKNSLLVPRIDDWDVQGFDV